MKSYYKNLSIMQDNADIDKTARGKRPRASDQKRHQSVQSVIIFKFNTLSTQVFHFSR